MKYLLINLLCLTSLAGPALAGEQSVDIARCKFGLSGKKEGPKCTAEASMCVNTGAVVTNTADGCKNILKVVCGGEPAFTGAWTPGYIENPETYIIQGSSTQAELNAPRILIVHGEDRDSNPSSLVFNDHTLTGECALMLKNGGSRP